MTFPDTSSRPADALPAPLHLPQRTPEQLAASLASFIQGHSAEADVNIFVYGLLAYQVPFAFKSQRAARLHGWQRRFNLADPMNRGTPEYPGLTLGLAAGGFCDGIVYQVAASHAGQALEKVWKQEMLLPFYRPAWCDIDGVACVVMLTDEDSPALMGALPEVEVQARLSQAEGEAGSNRAYLDDVVTAFRRVGVEDAYLAQIQQGL